MALVVGFVISAALAPLAISLAPRLGLIDRPGDDPLKVHKDAVPKTGGLAVIAALLPVPFLVDLPWQVVGGAIAVWALGILDDRFDLPPEPRLAVESAVGIVGATGISDDPIRFAIAALIIIVMINAANLYDGMDGLLAGSAAVSAIGLALLTADPTAALALGGALLGFLAFNFPPARLFLGDSGSYLVGYSLAVLVTLNFSRPAPALGALMILGLIAGDLALTVVRRIKTRNPLFVGDRSHLYDQIRSRGRTERQTLIIMWVGHGLLVVAGLLVATLEALAAAVVFAGVTALAASIVWRLGYLEIANE